MVQGAAKARARPVPDAAPEVDKVCSRLRKALRREEAPSRMETEPWEVSRGQRDAAVGVLRFLKVWFDVSADVFFGAVVLLDTFLARMKVQEKFLSCLTVSCFNLAATAKGFDLNTSHLVVVSQSKCSEKDMKRMSAIISQKLNLEKTQYSTALDILKIYTDIFKYVAVQFRIEGLLNRMLQWQYLSTRLEVLASDSACACYKSSVISLAFIHFEMERFLSREVPKKSHYYTMEMFYVLAVMIELQSLCNIDPNDYSVCFETISKVLKKYDAKRRSGHCQSLSWRFSVSTHALASSNYYPVLSTLEEE